MLALRAIAAAALAGRALARIGHGWLADRGLVAPRQVQAPRVHVVSRFSTRGCR